MVLIAHIRGRGAILALCLFLGGCHFVTTRKQGDLMREQISGLELQLDRMKEQRKELEEALASAKKDQEKLSEVLESAKQLLLRNSADLGAKFEVVETQVGKILGRLEDLEKDYKQKGALTEKSREDIIRVVSAIREDLDAFKAKVVAWHTKPQEPQGADELFEAAQKSYRTGAYVKARNYYQQFVDRHPDDPRAERAFFNLAESYARENKFGAAELSLRRFIKQFPDGKLAPAAWLLRAQCYQELKYCKNAIEILTQLRNQFPKSSEAAEALQRIKRLKKMLGSPRFCGN